jgi:hypothetical protein
MSLPKTDAERAQHDMTAAQAGPAENVVSTACAECDTRFACLAEFRVWNTGDEMPGWRLRCTVCGHVGMGELKPVVY